MKGYERASERLRSVLAYQQVAAPDIDRCVCSCGLYPARWTVEAGIAARGNKICHCVCDSQEHDVGMMWLAFIPAPSVDKAARV